MYKEIRLYIGRDPASKELFNQVVALIKSLPKEQRPKLKVKALRIKDPSEFEGFLAQLEELFGGIYTLEFRKYDIKSIPTIIVDGKKVIEGRYPTPEELRMIILGEELVPPQITARPRTENLQAEGPVKTTVEVKPIHREQAEMQKPISSGEERHTKETPISAIYEHSAPEEEQLEELKPIEIKPVELTEPVETWEHHVETVKPEAEKKPPVYPQPVTTQVAEQIRPSEELGKEEKEESLQRAVKPKPPSTTRDLKNTCFTCIFYNEERQRCTLYHIKVNDPYNPPCGRGRK